MKNELKTLVFLLLALLMLQVTACTDNQRARSFGGTEEVQLKPNEILLNVTWKEEHMWIVTKDTVTGISYCREKSSFGVVEGTIILKPNSKK